MQIFATGLLLLLAHLVLSPTLEAQQPIPATPQLEPIQVHQQIPHSQNPLLPAGLDQFLTPENNTTTIGGPRSSALRPQIRGLDADKLAISVDGVPVNVFTNHDGVVAIDPELVESVDLQPGADCAGPGPSNIGGSLHLRTIRPRSLLASLEEGANIGGQQKFSYASGSNATASTTHLFGQSNKWEGLLSYHQRQSQDQKLANGERLFHSAYQDTNWLWKNNWRLSSGTYQINLQRFTRQDRVPLNPSLNDPRDEGNSDNNLLRQQVLLQYQSPEEIYLANVFYLSNILEKRRLSDGRTDRRLRAATGMNWQANFPHWQWSSFVQHDQQTGRRDYDSLSSYPNGEALQLGLTLQRPFLWDRKGYHWELTPILRWDAFQLSRRPGESFLAPSLLVSWEASKGPQTFFHLRSAQAPPTISQLYAEGLHHLGDGFLMQDNYFVPNPSLRPEKSLLMETGQIYNWQNRWWLEWRQFFQHLDNFIYSQTIECVYEDTTLPCAQMSSGTTQFVNLPKARLQGSEVKMRYQNFQWWIQLSFAAVRGENSTTGEYLSNLPADSWKLQWRWQSPNLATLLGHQLSIVRAQRRINPRSLERIDATSGYSIHEFFARQRLAKGLELEMRLENAFGKNYRRHATFTPAGGRDWRLALSYQRSFF